MTELATMTPDHPRWAEFFERLEGPDGCDFQKDENEKVTWRCKGGMDKTFAVAILRDMGFSDNAISESVEFFNTHGGHCDCEILFNVEA